MSQQALQAAPAGFTRVQLKYGPYSASKLNVARCPARFQGKYILKDTIVADTLAAARGSAIHFMLEKISQARIAGEQLTTKKVDDLLAEAIGKFPAAYAQVDIVKRAAGAYIGNPSPYLSQETHCELELAVAVYEEESFLDDTVPNRVYVAVPPLLEDGKTRNPEAFMIVKIDQLSVDHIGKTVTVLDHKSTPNASTNQDHVFQTNVYGWIASLFYPGYRVRTVIHYAHPELNFYAPPFYLTDDDMRDTEDEVRAKIFAIESFQEYPALPSSQCDYCHMAQLCPEVKRVQEQNARGVLDLNVRGVNDLVRIAQSLRALGVLYDQVNKTLKEGIENLCPENGIAIDGMWYGFKPSDKKVDWKATELKIREDARKAQLLLDDPNLPQEQRAQLEEIVSTKDLTGLLAKHKMDPVTFKDWKSDKLKALFKAGRSDILQALNPFLVYDKETKFGGYKA